jgi:hypothetical protein
MKQNYTVMHGQKNIKLGKEELQRARCLNVLPDCTGSHSRIQSLIVAALKADLFL